MLILRLKQAEVALADGRLDEAYELALSKDVREHRRGQELVGRVARALVARGTEHLSAGRLAQAETDCHKAGALAGNLDEIGRLKEGIAGAWVARRQAEQRKAQALAAARQQVQQGHLTLGAQLLGGAEPAAAEAVLKDVQARRGVVETVLGRAGEALGRDDWEAAVGELAQARTMIPGDMRLRQLMVEAAGKAVEKIRGAIGSGRLDVAESLLRRMGPVASESVEAEELGRVLGQCRLAWGSVERGNYREAAAILRRVEAMAPVAEWIRSVVAALETAGETVEQLRCGPLAMLGAVQETGRGERMGMAKPAGRGVNGAAVMEHVNAEAGVGEEAGGLPMRLLVQVDGVGAFLVLRGRRVTLGPISAAHAPDLALMTDAATPAIAIERSDEDYFARSELPVHINGRLTCGKLLGNGDRIALSARCRLTFVVPSAASTTAVLDLAAARLPRADVRRVILLDRELIIGPGGGAHIRCDSMPEPVALVVRDGGLYCQTKGEVRVEDQPANPAAAIGLGQCVRAGEVSFVVTRM